MIKVPRSSWRGVYLIRSRSAHLRDDDELRIAWPVPKARAILSERDRKHPLLRDLPMISNVEPQAAPSSTAEPSRLLKKALATGIAV
jgi:hypothetical protein